MTSPNKGPLEILTEFCERSAETHALASNGALVSLEFSPQKYPGQSWDSREGHHLEGHLEGEPHESGTVLALGSLLDSRMPEFVDGLLEQNDNNGRLDQIGQTLEEKRSVFLLGAHGKGLIDPGFSLAATYIALDRLGYKGFRTSEVVGKVPAFLARQFPSIDQQEEIGQKTANSLPIMSVLRTAFSDLFITLPITPSTEELRQDERVEKAMYYFNLHTGKIMLKYLNKNTALMGIEAGGTTNKPLEGDPNTIVVGKLGDETAGLLKKGARRGAKTIGIATWIDESQWVMELSSDVLDVKDTVEEKSQDKAQAIQDSIINSLNDKVEGLRFIYDTEAERLRATLGSVALPGATEA